MHAHHTEDFTCEGFTFRATLYPDDSSDPPWENECGHGPVRFIDDREPLERGEVVLYDAPRGRYVYNFGAALVQASRGGWGLNPEDLQRLTARLGKRPTRGQIRAESVRHDMAHLRGWCASDWCYVGVCVQRIGSDGEPMGNPYEHALWGVESSGDYWREIAAELANELMPDTRAQESALADVGA